MLAAIWADQMRTHLLQIGSPNVGTSHSFGGHRAAGRTHLGRLYPPCVHLEIGVFVNENHIVPTVPTYFPIKRLGGEMRSKRPLGGNNR